MYMVKPPFLSANFFKPTEKYENTTIIAPKEQHEALSNL